LSAQVNRLVIERGTTWTREPHIGAAKNNASPYFAKLNAMQRGSKMRAGIVGIAVVVAIGLIWSVAVMSKLVPVDGSEMRAATSPHVGDQALLIR
jgi:hypothetical protein